MKLYLAIALSSILFITPSFAQEAEVNAEDDNVFEFKIEQKIDKQKAIAKDIYNFSRNNKPHETKRFVEKYNQLKKRYSKYDEKEIRVNSKNPNDVKQFMKKEFSDKIVFENPETKE